MNEIFFVSCPKHAFWGVFLAPSDWLRNYPWFQWKDQPFTARSWEWLKPDEVEFPQVMKMSASTYSTKDRQLDQKSVHYRYLFLPGNKLSCSQFCFTKILGMIVRKGSDTWVSPQCLRPGLEHFRVSRFPHIPGYFSITPQLLTLSFIELILLRYLTC